MESKNKLQTPQKALKLDKPKSTKSSKKKALLSNVPIPINEMQCCEAKQSEIKEQKSLKPPRISEFNKEISQCQNSAANTHQERKQPS